MATDLVAGTAFRGRAGLLCGTALQAVALLVVAQPAFAQPAPGARPGGGQVTGGSATIGQTAAQTTINQASQRAAIDWRSFDIGRDHIVQFNQPGASAITLNRVTGPDPSSIAGRIQANGQVVITNQSGVTFHKGAQVDTAGLIVSAAGISTQNFMAGRMVFDQAPHPDAAVTNAGDITIKQAGLAALVAPRVANTGTIRAPMGKVVLAGAETHTVDLYGDGLLSIDVTRQVRTAPRGPDGKAVTGLVTNTGIVVADGGTVLLTAAAADGIVQNLVEAGGRIQANTAGGRVGRIAIAGVGGSVRIEGRLDATGGTAGHGGEIAVAPTSAVTVTNGARIRANGGAGGGSVALGAGAGIVSGSVAVAPGARIAANGRGAGSGGRVTALSQGQTRIEGRLSAQAGKKGGDGGAVEVSGATVGITGTVTTAAPAGRSGKILIDPADIRIANDGGPNSISTASIEAMTGSITLTATNSVVAAVSVTLTNPRVQDFTLDGGNFVQVNEGVTLTAPQNIIFRAGALGVSIQGSARSTSTTDSEGIRFFTSGAVTQGPNSTLTAPSLGGTVGSAILDSRLNQLSAVGGGTRAPLAFVATVGDISVVNSLPLVVGSPDFGGGIRVPTGRQVTIAADGITLVPGPIVSRGTVLAAPPPFPVSRTPAILAPNGMVTILPFTAGTALELTAGAKTAGRLSMTNADLTTIEAASLTFGAPNAGPASIAPGLNSGVVFPVTLPSLNLLSGGDVTQAGTLSVGTLSGRAASLQLGANGNAIPVLNGFTTSGGVFFHTDASLLVSGPVRGANVALSSGGTAPDQMTLAADIAGARVRLDSTNGNGTSTPIIQTAGVITAQDLTGAGGTVLLSQANQVQSLNGFTAGTSLDLVTVPSLSTGGTVSAGSLSLQSTGTITQAAGSALQVGSLTGSAAAATFDRPDNQVGQLQTFTTTAGDFALTTQLSEGSPFSISGTTTVPTGRNITIIADQLITRLGDLAAPAGRITLAPLTAGRGMELTGTGAAASGGTLSLGQDVYGRLSTGTLQLGNGQTGPIAIGAAGDAISLAGIANTLDLRSTGAVTQPGASLTVGTLTGSTASLSLDKANAVGTLGSYIAASSLTVRNSAGLRVAGPITVGTFANIGSAQGLSLSGSITAPVVSLAGGAPGITQTAGLIAGTTLVSLNTPGPLVQTGGTLATPLLTGSAGSVVLPAAGNQIAAIGPFTTAGDFLLTNGRSLRVAAPVDPGDVTLNVAGDLVLNSSVTANTLTLNVTGAVTEVAGPSVSGSVFATTLQGQAGSVRLDLVNRVGTVAGFVSTGGFLLFNDAPLAVAGPLTDQAAIVLRSAGPMTLAGTMLAPDITLATLNVRGQPPAAITQIAGTVTAPGTLTFNAADAILQTAGTLVAGAITGRSGATTKLNAAGNRVTALGSFASAGGFELTDSVALVQSGALTDTARITLNAPAGIALGGTVTAPAVDLRGGAVTQLGGSIVTGTLTGAVAGAALDRLENNITNLGTFSSTGDASLTTSGTLNVTGAASAGFGRTLSLTAGQIALQPGGNLSAPAGVVALAPVAAGAPFTLSSFVPAGTVAAITADTLQVGKLNAGTITVAGPFALPGVTTLRLLSGTGLVEAPGASLAVGRLTGQAAFAALDGANQVGVLGPFTTSTGFSLNNVQQLDVSGPVQDGTRVQLRAGGNLTLSGDIVAPSIDLAAAGELTQTGGALRTGLLTGSAASISLPSVGNRITAIGPLRSSGAFALTNSQTLTVSGPVSYDTGTFNIAGDLVINGTVASPGLGTTVNLSGNLTQGVGGRLSITTLGGQAGSVLLEQDNAVTNVSNLTTRQGITLATGSALTAGTLVSGAALTLRAAGPLAMVGDIAAPAVTLIATPSTRPGSGTITQTGGTIRTSALNLTASGDVLQSGGGIAAATLTGVAGGSVTLNAPGNQIGTVGAFTAAGLAITNAQALTVQGPLQAASITLAAPGVILQGGSLGGGPVSIQGGTITQTGTTTVDAPTLRLGGGPMTFANLVAPQAAVTLNLGGTTASGTVNLGGLLVVGAGARVDLFGTVAGQGGFGAAIASRISPRFDPAYQINNCAIASVTCTATPPPLPPPVRVFVLNRLFPQAFLLQGFLRPDLYTADLVTLAVSRDPSDPDVVLPNISDRDY